MTTTGKVLTATAVISIIYLFAKDKVNNWKETIKFLRMLPTSVSNIRVEDGKLKLEVGLKIINPTSQDFKPNIIATLKRVVFTDKLGNLIGQVSVNKSSIVVPAMSSVNLSKMLVELPIAWNIENLENLTSLTLADIKTKAVISVLGQEFTI